MKNVKRENFYNHGKLILTSYFQHGSNRSVRHRINQNHNQSFIFTAPRIFVILSLKTPPMWVGGWLLRRVGSSDYIDSIYGKEA